KANRTPLGRYLMWRRDVEGAKKLRAAIEEVGNQFVSGTMLANVTITGKLPAALTTFPPSTNPDDVRRRTFLLQIDVEASAYVGDVERVMNRFQQCAEAGLIDINWADRCPLFDQLRSDPRFASTRAIVKKRADEIIAAFRAA